MEVPPLVFAPGMMCDQRLFQAQLDHFSHAPALYTADFSKDDTIEAMTERLLKHAPPRFFLTGLSMGGIVALEACHRQPERCLGMALLNTTPLADAAEKRPLRLAQMQAVCEGRLVDVVKDELKPHYLGPESKANARILQIIAAMAQDLGQDTFLRQSRALMERIDRRPLLGLIHCPTLLISGSHDTLCPPHLHEDMARLMPKAQHVCLDACGHLSSMEAPADLNRLLAKMLREL